MIYATAALSTLLLASGATAIDFKKQHLRNVAQLKKKVSQAPRVAVSEDEVRRLETTTSFLNYDYSSDAACAVAPYSYTGSGMGSCERSGDNTTSTIWNCEGTSDMLNISSWTFSTPDCTGNASFGYTNLDGSCGNGGDDGGDDGYYTITCETSRSPTNSQYDYSFYEDSDCDMLISYYGANYGRCTPSDGPGDYYVIFNEDCSETYYADSACTVQATEAPTYAPTASPTLVSAVPTNTAFPTNTAAPSTAAPTFEFAPTFSPTEAGNPYAPVTCSSLDDFPEFDDDGDEFDLDDDLLPPGDYITLVINQCSASSGGDDDDDDDVCFAGSETVLLESGATKAIAEVEIGDVVQVVSADGSLAFSEVVFLPHAANTQKATFTELQMDSGNSLRATASHLVLAGACGADAFELTAMKDVTKGNCVQTTNGEDQVTGSGLVVDHGIYTVVTKESSGLIVVNGVRASSFGTNHWLVNNYYNIHRAVYEVAPSMMKNRNVVAANLMVGDIAASL